MARTQLEPDADLHNALGVEKHSPAPTHPRWTATGLPSGHVPSRRHSPTHVRSQDRTTSPAGIHLVVELGATSVIRALDPASSTAEALAERLRAGDALYLVAADQAWLQRRDAAPAELLPVTAEELMPGLASGPPERRENEDSISYLMRARRERGRIALKAKQWAAVLGRPITELERAIHHGAVASTVKRDGRDHGARLVSVDALLQYLTTARAVSRGLIAPPAWWAAVNPGKEAA